MTDMRNLLIEAVSCIRFNVERGSGKPSDDIRSLIARIDAALTDDTRSGSQGVADDAMVERAISAFMEATRQAQLDDKYGERLICGKDAMRAALLAAMGGGGEPFEKCGTCGDEIREGEPHRYSSGGLTCWRCLKKSLPPPPTTISEERAI